MSALPQALCREAALLLQRRWKEWLETGESVEVSGDQEEAAAQVDLALSAPGQHRRVEASARVEVPAGAADPQEALDRALDAAEAFLGEWLEGGRAERAPIDFVPAQFEDHPVQVRLRITRPILEEEADRLLGDDEPPAS